MQVKKTPFRVYDRSEIQSVYNGGIVLLSGKIKRYGSVIDKS
jgi:hypothetical protein